MNSLSTDNIGSVIRFHRKKAGLSQNALADLAGVGKTVVFDIEKNKQSVQWDSLGKVLRALNIRIVFASPVMKEMNEEMRRGNNEES